MELILKFLLLCVAAGAVVYGADCPEGYERNGLSCYLFNTELKTWNDAEAYCQSMSGAHLTAIESLDEDIYIFNKIITLVYQDTNYWIGLTKEPIVGADHYWIDGSVVDYTLWNYGEPNDSDGTENCVYAYTYNSFWNDHLCTDLQASVCRLKDFVTPVWEVHNSREYMISYLWEIPPTHWHNSRDYCMENGADLLSLNSEDEKNFILSVTQNYDDVDYWNGLNALRDRQNFEWSDGSTLSYTHWDTANPDIDQTLGSYCVYQKGSFNDARWYSNHCDKEKYFICEREQNSAGAPVTDPPHTLVAGFCPAGYVSVSDSNKCFKVVIPEGTGVTWDEALNLCRQTVVGGVYPDLASIHSEKQMDVIKTQLQTHIAGVWIGLFKDNADNPWLWVDSSAFEYTNWAFGEPNSYYDLCAEAFVTGTERTGQWNDITCDAHRAYVCEVHKDPAIPNHVTPSSYTICPTGYRGYWYGCYKVHPSATSWELASTTCVNEGGNLVSIHSEPENSAVKLALEAAGVTNLWTGGKNTEGEFKWSDGWLFSYTSWGEGQPANVDNACILMTGGGSWSVAECSSTQPFMCKQTEADPLTHPPPGPGTCPDNWIEYGNHCYYHAVYQYVDWQTANIACLNLNPGASLASIHNQEESIFINNYLDSVGSTYDVWLGLYRSKTDNGFNWIDGSTVQYTNWAPLEPNGEADSQDCVELYRTAYVGKWNDHACTDFQDYMCKMPKIQDVTVTNVPGTTPAPGVCPSGWYPEEDDCFLFEPNLYKSQSAAQDYCQQMGGPDSYLAGIDSAEENTFIHTKMQELTAVPTDPVSYWIGLAKTDGEWGWMDGCYVGYTGWAVGEPNDHDGQEVCADAYWNSGEWNDIKCSQAIGFVCRIRMNGCYKGEIEWRTYNGYEYYIAQELEQTSFTYYQGYDYCLANGGDLVSIHDTEEQKFITDWLAESQIYDVSYFIGLNSLKLKDMSAASFTWSDLSDNSFTSWQSGYPHDGSTGHYCVDQPAKNNQGFWYNIHCDDKRGFICKRKEGDTEPKTEPATPVYGGYCPDGYIGVGETGNKCYKLVTGGDNDNGATWDEAMDICRQGPGLRPDLASIINDYQMALVKTQLQEKGFGFWIGSRRQTDNDQWRWVNNDRDQYNNWSPGYPEAYAGSNCIEVRTTDVNVLGQWVNADCAAKRGYICETYKDGSVGDPPVGGVTCDEGFTPYWFECLKVNKNAVTWQQAKEDCDLNQAFLPSIHTEAENSAFQLIAKKLGSPIWIGMMNYENTGDYRWEDGWHVVYTKWGDGEPADQSGTGGCVALHGSGRWSDEPCDTLYPSVCKKTDAQPLTTPGPLEGECPDPMEGMTWKEYGSHCYLFDTVSTNIGWASAQQLCVTRHPTANLISIHDHLENDWVTKQFAEANSYTSAWIGYFRTPGVHDFEWIDSSVNNFQKFAQGEPNGLEHEGQECVEIYPTGGFSGLWNDHGCQEARHFGCKMPKLSPMTTPEHLGGACGDGWESYGSGCYLFVPDDHVKYDTAKEACVSFGVGATLASIHSDDENSWIMKRISEYTHYPSLYNFWIGLKKDNTIEATEPTMMFTWEDGTSNGYGRWASGEPNDYDGVEDCVNVYVDSYSYGLWNDINCHEPFGYVCKYLKVGDIDTSNTQAGTDGGTIAGIVIGTLIGVAVVGVVIFLGLSYMGVVSGPIPAHTTGGGSSGSGFRNPFASSGFKNDLYDNGDSRGTSNLTDIDNVQFVSE